MSEYKPNINQPMGDEILNDSATNNSHPSIEEEIRNKNPEYNRLLEYVKKSIENGTPIFVAGNLPLGKRIMLQMVSSELGVPIININEGVPEIQKNNNQNNEIQETSR